MIRSDMQDQQLCAQAHLQNLPLPPRIWPKLSQTFEVLCTSEAEADITHFARTTDEELPLHPSMLASAASSSSSAGNGAGGPGAGVERVDYEYRTFKLNINPYLALASALELGAGKGYLDERTSRVHYMLATARGSFNRRLPQQYRV